MSNDAIDRDYRSALYLQSSVERMNEITVDDFLQKAARLEEAAEKMKRAAGYKDADERAKSCEEQAKALREKAAKAGSDSAAAKKRKLIFSIIALVGIAVAIVFTIYAFMLILEPDEEEAPSPAIISAVVPQLESIAGTTA